MTPLTCEILLALSNRDRHGYGMIREIERLGGSSPSTGAVYLALQRMVADGLVLEVAAPVAIEDACRR